MLVVGAGPTGLMAASELRRHRVECRLIDRAPIPHREARATGVQARTLEILERTGIVEPWLAAGRRLSRIRSLAPDGTELRSLSLEGLETPYPFVLSIQQRLTEAFLTEHLRRLGCHVEHGVELVELREDAGHVEVVLAGPGGRLERADFDYVVGADGLHSSVREEIGIVLGGAGDYAGVFSVAEVELDWSYPTDELIYFVAAPNLVMVGPLAEGRVLLVADDPEGRPGEPPHADELRAILAGRAPAPPPELKAVHWSSRFHLHCRLASAMRRGRVLLAGDAAHVCSLFGGQGLNMGIHDAHNLGWKLALVVSGRAGETLLASYEAERRPAAEAELAFTDASHRALFASAASWPPSALGHEAAFLGSTDTAARRRLLALAELDVDLRGSDIVTTLGDPPEGGLVAGDWVPDGGVRLASGDEAKLSTLLGGGGHVVLVTADSDRGPVDAVLDRARVPIACYPLAGVGEIAERIGQPPALVAVRPDGYAGLVSRPVDAGALERYLDELCAS